MNETPKENNSMPFAQILIPVIHKLNDLDSFIKKYEGYKFCVYIADKDNVGWTHSTSRQYMNKILPGLIYLPFNIKRDDHHILKRFYQYCEEHEEIVAINQTKPHISNPVLFELYPASPLHVDALIRNKFGKLKPIGLEGRAFTGWFTEDVGPISDKTVICFGVGSTGEGIVHQVMKKEPKKVYLIDIRSKVILAEDLGEQVVYRPRLSDLEITADDNILFIYTLGKEFKDSLTDIADFIDQNSSIKNIFVDIRPQLKLETVEKAKSLGWTGYTGSAMTARNNFVLIEKIANVIGAKCPDYKEFEALVNKVVFNNLY